MRKLLWEKVPAENVTALLAGRSTEETRRLLSDGVAFIARHASGEVREIPYSGAAEVWRRVTVGPGIELHVREGLPKPKPGELKQLVGRLEAALLRRQ